MKKVRKYVGIVMMMIVLLALGCDGTGPGNPGNQVENDSPPTSGRLTITGLEAYNGYYICAQGSNADDGPGDYVNLFASGGINFSEQTGIGTRISNGKAVLNVWEMIYNRENESIEGVSYNGNDQNVFLIMEIFSGSTWPCAPNDRVALAIVDPVNFSNGIATAAVSYIRPLIKVNLGNGIEGTLNASYDEFYQEGYININTYDHVFAIERNDENYEQDFELYVDNNLVPFSNTLSLSIGSGLIDFYYSDTDLLTIGESSEIRIKYTANPDRPIKVWIPEDEEDWYEPPANAAILGSFDTGNKTVTVKEEGSNI